MTNIQARLLGLGLLAGGAFMLIVFVIIPLMDIRDHARHITISTAGTILTPVLLTIGVLYLVYGAKVIEVVGERYRPTGYGILVGVCAFAFGLMLCFIVNNEATKAGYVEDHGEIIRRGN